jgi:hypothetical protein
VFEICIPVFLGQAEIDNVNESGFLAQTDQEIVGLDVAMNEVLCVHVFNARQLKN